MNTILEGTIDTIFPAEVKGMYEKRVIWLKEKADKKPNFWQLTFEGNDGAILDKFKPGQEVACNIEVRGFKWGTAPKISVYNVLKCTLINHLH